MTITVPAALLTHEIGECTTLARLYKAALKNGTVYGFTGLDRDVPYGGVTYKADSGFAPSDYVFSDTLAVDNMEVTGYLDSSQITRADLDAGIWDGATITVYEVNYADLTMTHTIVSVSTIGQITQGKQQLIAEIRGLTQALDKNIVRLIGSDCQHDFCDTNGIKFGSGCSLSAGAWTVTGTVASVSSDTLTIHDAARTEANHYYTGGMITWTSGLNNGLKMETSDNTSGQFTLSLPMPYAITVGDTYSLLAGCDKSKATCIARSNMVNHGGFPDVPGIDRVLLAADAQSATSSSGSKF
jgi:uncharacterized phage protein (TIGR02218 family)